MVTRKSLIWVAVLCIAVALTNRYTDVTRDRALIGEAAGDTFSYLAMAEAAPALTRDTLPFHHAQRIAIPYAIGLVHDLTHVPLHRLFLIAVFAIEGAILLVVAGALRTLAVGSRESMLALGMLALSPWAFRFYVTFPEMVNDLGFVLGLAIVVRGLLGGSAAGVIAGQLVASASRQTGLLLVPFILLWLWADERTWGRRSKRARVLVGAVPAFGAAAIYLLTAVIASSFAAPSENAEHLLGVATWFTREFDQAALVSVMMRMLAGVAFPVSCFAGIARLRRSRRPDSSVVPLLLFGAACCWVQPVLAGPGITAGNGERLIGLGLVPLVLALAIRMRDAGAVATFDGRTLGAMIGLLVAGSLHHRYTAPGILQPGDRYAFAGLYLFVCTAAFGLLLRKRSTNPVLN